MKNKLPADLKLKLTRRELLEMFGAAIAAGTISAACSAKPINRAAETIMPISKNQTTNATAAARNGRLSARLPSKPAQTIESGQHGVQIDKEREALLYVPNGFKNALPAPFALLLHGAGGNAQHGIGLLQHYADRHNMVLLAPKSRHATWDVIADEYGVDVAFIDRALQFVFERCSVDPSRLAIGGFSDGASYALSLGLINGDLFSHVIAFSPGFMAVTKQTGAPEIFISHGTDDRVLPINRCSRRLAPQLERAGYAVTYREFDGGHVIPPNIASAAVEILIA